MNPDELLIARINLITEAVVRQDWGRAYELIEEWESDDRLFTSSNRELLDSIPYDGWEVVDSAPPSNP
jgi:hypothetical protein